MRIPSGLDWWRSEPGGSQWLEALPGVVTTCAERWSLRLGEPYPDSHVSLVLPVERDDGTLAALKVNFPDEESETEADALAHWNGRGAVRLLEHDEQQRALLVERCSPGSQLWAVDDDAEATCIASGVLGEIRRAPPIHHRFRGLADVAEAWAEELERDWRGLGKPFERELLEVARGACLELGRDQSEQVVLHQDFHGGNVLRAGRNGWLAIDPKPLVGEPAFDAASLLRDRRWLLGRGGEVERVRRRLDIVTSELSLDRERTRLWGLAHALAWGVSGQKLEEDMIECARLLLAIRA